MKSRSSKLAISMSIVLAILLSFFVANAYAINLMFMSKQAPARKYSDTDWQYLNRAIDHTLANVDDGASYRWNNPASPANGLLEVLESTNRDDMPCRRARLTNYYDESKGVTEFVFCKQPDGEWKVAQ